MALGGEEEDEEDDEEEEERGGEAQKEDVKERRRPRPQFSGVWSSSGSEAGRERSSRLGWWSKAKAEAEGALGGPAAMATERDTTTAVAAATMVGDA